MNRNCRLSKPALSAWGSFINIIPWFLVDTYPFLYSVCTPIIHSWANGKELNDVKHIYCFPLHKKNHTAFHRKPNRASKPQFGTCLSSSYPLASLPSHKGALLSNEIFSKWPAWALLLQSFTGKTLIWWMCFCTACWWTERHQDFVRAALQNPFLVPHLGCSKARFLTVGSKVFPKACHSNSF